MKKKDAATITNAKDTFSFPAKAGIQEQNNKFNSIECWSNKKMNLFFYILKPMNFKSIVVYFHADVTFSILVTLNN